MILSYAVFILTLISSSLFGLAFSARLNSLEANGHWTSTKNTVECYINGAAHYFSGPQAVNHRHLDLGAWFGFQEVIRKEPVDPKEINFDFYLPKDSYFYAVFNKDETGFSGIRLSTSSLYDNCFFNAEDNGRFIDQTVFKNDDIQVDSWNSCKLVFSSGTVCLFLNDGATGAFNLRMKHPQLFGFRGSAHNVLIDDIAVVDSGGRTWKDSFFNVDLFLRWFLIGFALIMVPQTAYGIFLMGRKTPLDRLWNRLLLFNARVLVIATILCGFVPFWNARYPSTTGFLRRLQRQEDAFLKAAPRLISENIMGQYGKEPAKDRYRICFFGTSQTGGAGAKKKDDMFVARFERLLNASNHGPGSFECINPSVGGGDTTRMLPYYENEWVTLKPKLVIVNLSTNDEPDVFGPNLQRIVDINKNNGIKTIFVLEPNSLEFPDDYKKLSLKHEIMRSVARNNNIPLLDAYQYMKAHNNDGILWWDIVHLTSFGHELMANFLLENVKPILDAESRTRTRSSIVTVRKGGAA